MFICLFVQDEDKKSGAGDGQTTEDESSQDSKGESVGQAEAQGNMDVDQPNKTEQSEPATEGQDCVLTRCGLTQCSSTLQLTFGCCFVRLIVCYTSQTSFVIHI